MPMLVFRIQVPYDILLERCMSQGRSTGEITCSLEVHPDLSGCPHELFMVSAGHSLATLIIQAIILPQAPHCLLDAVFMANLYSEWQQRCSYMEADT